MAGIKLLDTHTINKIAAGEVVERPASVVKELVENSIDAKASSVTVEIKNGGIDFIRITDNGVGIPKDEVEIAFLRHATSKIGTVEDLLKVISLGFRGEALASIAAVAHVELITKTPDELTGKRVEVQGGKIVSSDEIACPEGTTLIMRHLFFNVPARREFLKTPGGEGAKIADCMYKLALAHPEISFKYIQNNKLIFNTSGNHDLESCVFQLYGKEMAKESIKVHYEDSGIELVGLIGKPTLTKANRNYEHFFINGRYIKSFVLQKAVEEAYKTLIMIGKFPFVALHLHVDPSKVDVNVHPTKLQVRFKNEDQVYQVVYEGVKRFLRQENLVPTLELIKEKKPTVSSTVKDNTQLAVDSFFTPRKIDNALSLHKMVDVLAIKKEDPMKQSPKIFDAPSEAPTSQNALNNVHANDQMSSPSSQTLRGEGDSHKVNTHTVLEGLKERPNEVTARGYEESIPNVKPNEHIAERAEVFSSQEESSLKSRDSSLKSQEAFLSQQEVALEPRDSLSTQQMVTMEQVEVVALPQRPVHGIDYRIIGQLYKTYWLIEHHGKVLLMDQHAAHERIMYEKYMASFREGTIQSQMLLMPETIQLTNSEKVVLEENEALLTKLGFNFEVFGDNAIIIREVPYLFNKPLSIQSLKYMLESIDALQNKTAYEFKEDAIIQLSCKSAIKANDKISEEECHYLIEELLILENPYSCPHGRPTIVALTQTDIEKIFKRI